jgi:hypothetical protein
MLSRYALIAVTLGALGSLTAVEAAPGGKDTSGPYEFVGFSDPADKVLGDVGYPGMAAACQATFGLLARISTTQEYILSPNVLAPDPETAWINPTILNGFFWPVDQSIRAIDFSGVSAKHQEMSCNGGWRGGGSGMTVSRGGGMVTGSCGVARLVACSAPPQ